MNLLAEENLPTHTLPLQLERHLSVTISSKQKQQIHAREARPSFSAPNMPTKVRPRRLGSPSLPSEEVGVPHTLFEERNQQPTSARDTGPADTAATEHHILNARSREHVERSSPRLDNRNTRSAPTQGALRSTRRREPGRQDSGDSTRAEVDDQTRQMVRAIEELRNLNGLFESYSSSSTDNEDHDPRARQLRRRVMIPPDIVDEFERQLIRANYLVWNGAQLPSKFSYRGPYNEEIMNVLRTTLSPQERLTTFKTMLQSLQLHFRSGHACSTARKEKIRQLELVLQDVSIDLTLLDHQKERRSMDLESTSSTLSSNASAFHSSRVGSRSHRVLTPRTVHLVRPLEDVPSRPP